MVKKEVIQKKDIFIYRYFKEGINFIFESKNYILLMVVLFFFSISFGYAFPNLFKEQLLKMIEELLNQTKGLGFFSLISFIMVNNIKSSFFGLYFGIFFGIVPVSMIIVNGFLLGFVMNKAVIAQGPVVLWKLFPHGIFEIPAILISTGIGLKLGLFYFRQKDKLKGSLAFIFSFGGFWLLFSIFSVIIALFAGSYFPNLTDYYTFLMKDSFFFLLYLLMLLLFFGLSVFLGLLVFSKKERKEVGKDFFYEIKNAIKVFILIVIPLLVIAGIIEGTLIAIFGG